MSKNKTKKQKKDLLIYQLPSDYNFQRTLLSNIFDNGGTLTGGDTEDDIAKNNNAMMIGSIANLGSTVASEAVDLAIKDQYERTNVGKAGFKGYLQGTGQGAQIGSAFGPWGTLIGAAAGGLHQGIQGLVTGKKSQKAQHDALIERYYGYNDGGFLSEVPPTTDNTLGNFYGQRRKKFGLSDLELEEEQNRLKFPNGGSIDYAKYIAEREKLEGSGSVSGANEMTVEQFKSWAKSKALPFHSDIPEGATGITRYKGIGQGINQGAVGQYWTNEGYTYIPKYEESKSTPVNSSTSSPSTPSYTPPVQNKDTLSLPQFSQVWINDDSVPGGGYFKNVKNIEERLPGDVSNLEYGGDLNTNIYKGPRHEQGGIAVGNNAEVEGGEVRVEDYIFSDSLTINGKKTFAQEAKSIMKKYEERPSDGPSQRAMQKQLSALMSSNELARKQKEFTEEASNKGLLDNFGSMIQYKNGGILINAENRDVFTKEAKRRGMKVHEFASEVIKQTKRYGGKIKEYDNGGKLSPISSIPQEKEEYKDYFLELAKSKNISLKDAYQEGGILGGDDPKKSKYGTQPFTMNSELPEDFEQEGATHEKVGSIKSALKAMRINKKIRNFNLDYQRVPFDFFKTKGSDEVPTFKFGGKWAKKYPNGGSITNPLIPTPLIQDSKLSEEYKQNLLGLEQEAQTLGDKIMSGKATKDEVKRFDELPDERLYLSKAINEIDYKLSQEVPAEEAPQTDFSLVGSNGNNLDLPEEELISGKTDFTPKIKKKLNFGNEEAALIASSLPSIQNLMRSVNPATTQFQRYKPEELNLEKARLATAREASMARNIAGANARGARSSGQVLSTLSAGNAAITESKMASDLQSFIKEDTANVGIRNEAKKINTDIAMQEYIANEQNKAMAQSIGNMGLSDLGTSIQGYTRDKALSKENLRYNKEVLSLVNQMFPSYRWNVDPATDEKVLTFINNSIDKKNGQ